MTEFFKQFFCEKNEEYSVIVEDDGKVAYAYLYQNSDILGDVWLYNQELTPEEAMWHQEDMPFLNPKEFVKKNISPISEEDEVEIRWHMKDGKELVYLTISIHGEIVAKMTHGAMPAWSSLVLKDGPLALVLHDD